MYVICQGCGKIWEVDEIPFDHARAEIDSHGDPVPIQCGPIDEYPNTAHIPTDEGEK